MKKITLLLLLITALSYGQDKQMFRFRTKDVYNSSLKKYWHKPTPADAYAHEKYKDLSEQLDFVQKDSIKLKAFFKDQYPAFKDAYEKFDKTETAQSKIDLIKILVTMEEDFRKFLDDKQLLYYKQATSKKFSSNNAGFIERFLSDADLTEYKLQLL